MGKADMKYYLILTFFAAVSIETHAQSIDNFRERFKGCIEQKDIRFCTKNVLSENFSEVGPNRTIPDVVEWILDNKAISNEFVGCILNPSKSMLELDTWKIQLYKEYACTLKVEGEEWKVEQFYLYSSME